MFRVSLEDSREFHAILNELNDVLGPGIDKANVFRGFVTLWNLSRRELLEAARSHERIKPPNTREPSEVFAVDQLIHEIEASAFRRSRFRNR